MVNLPGMIWIEFRKAMRSKMPLWTALGFLMMSLAGAFSIFIFTNPELSLKLGLISAKANLMVSSADWPAYLKLTAQMTAVGGFFFFCMVISWVFGREFVDHTLKDWLAVPVPRESILLAKFIVVAIWCAALSLEVILVTYAMGALLRLPQGSVSVLLHGIAVLGVTTCLVIVLVFPFAFFASLGRGYLLPLGMVIITMILANVLIVAGWGEVFPWSVAGLYTQGEALPPYSYWTVVVTGLAGMLATYAWWMRADQSR